MNPNLYIQAPENWMNYNRYSYALNNPLIYTDPTGEFIFTALFAPVGLAPLGAIIDGASWGALTGAISYTATTTFGVGGFNNWDSGKLGNSILTGAISGAVFTGMGLISPSFTVTSNNFMNNLPTYLGKAGGTTLTGALTTGSGMLMNDLQDDGKINNHLDSYFTGIGLFIRKKCI